MDTEGIISSAGKTTQIHSGNGFENDAEMDKVVGKFSENSL
jgi:hypothetical protein